jgi:hypothetical protein
VYCLCVCAGVLRSCVALAGLLRVGKAPGQAALCSAAWWSEVAPLAGAQVETPLAIADVTFIDPSRPIKVRRQRRRSWWRAHQGAEAGAAELVASPSRCGGRGGGAGSEPIKVRRQGRRSWWRAHQGAEAGAAELVASPSRCGGRGGGAGSEPTHGSGMTAPARVGRWRWGGSRVQRAVTWSAVRGSSCLAANPKP